MKSNRRDFLRLTGLAGAATVIPFKNVFPTNNDLNLPDECVLIPTETAGPFPLDLTDGIPGLQSGSLVYQLEVTNSSGTFKDSRMMTLKV